MTLRYTEENRNIDMKEVVNKMQKAITDRAIQAMKDAMPIKPSSIKQSFQKRNMVINRAERRSTFK